MKAAFVVARYGMEINGGAEQHCRMVAERLKDEWDIEVLSTCAMDYVHWNNHFPAGSCQINGITARRFPVDYPRPINTFNNVYDLLISLHLLKQNIDIPLDSTEHIERLFSGSERQNTQSLLPKDLGTKVTDHIAALEEIWLKLQGPYSSQLFDYIRHNKDHYDLFIFFTLNYCTTFFGLELAADRAAIVPTMHREACISFELFKGLFSLPKFILYNTVEEQQLANQVFPQSQKTPYEVVGVGVTASSPQNTASGAKLIKDKLSYDRPYVLYLGRIEESKGCLDLCHFFVNYNERTGKKLTLIFAGKKICGLPQRDDVVHAGFVSEEEKIHLLSNALVVCVPSLFESLSMVLLEAWNLETPTLVNGQCAVLKGHINRGNGGFYYHDEASFQKTLDLLLENPSLRKTLGKAGKNYVNEHYTWPAVLEKYRRCAAAIKESTGELPS